MNLSKKLSNKELLLYGITEEFKGNEALYLKKIEESLKGGVTILQMREKHLDYNDFLKLGVKLKSLCDRYKVKLIINDYISIAKELGTAGVHLGQSDDNIQIAKEVLGEDSIVGISAKTVDEAVLAENCGADYVGVGAIFNTQSKKTSTITKDEFLKIKGSINIPVVAIGGICSNNIEVLNEYETNGVAIINDIYSKPVENIKSHCKVLKDKIDNIVR